MTLEHQRAAASSVQSLGEEIANSITHGLGAVLSIVALTMLVIYASYLGDVWRIVSFSIFGTSLFLLYLSSTLYHGFSNQRVKQIFHVIDHSTIYLLIAGTYTPVVLVPMRGPWGWTLFGLVWAMAISGIIFKMTMMGRFKRLSILAYVAMGCLILIAAKPMFEILPSGLIFWMFLGGACYIFGIIFYLWKRLPYHHAIWHLFVLGGSASHFFGMLFYLA